MKDSKIIKKRTTLIDLTGLVFGKLTVVDRNMESKNKAAYWNCLCECKSVCVRGSRSLIDGRSWHCGCSINNSAKGVTHGLSKTPTYITWSNMKMRCLNKNRKGYDQYGAAGISIDPNWHTYENFLADMGERPSFDHSIDRIDNSKGYCKENCRWATKREQSRNRKHVTYYCFRGQNLTIGDIAKLTNHPEERLRYRVRDLGWSIERAVGTPPLDNKNRYFYLRQMSNADWAMDNSDLK